MNKKSLSELIHEAQKRYDNMNDSGKLRMWYEQRRSFVRSARPGERDKAVYEECLNRRMPPESKLTDAQIGLVLMGYYQS